MADKVADRLDNLLPGVNKLDDPIEKSTSDTTDVLPQLRHHSSADPLMEPDVRDETARPGGLPAPIQASRELHGTDATQGLLEISEQDLDRQLVENVWGLVASAQQTVSLASTQAGLRTLRLFETDAPVTSSPALERVAQTMLAAMRRLFGKDLRASPTKVHVDADWSEKLFGAPLAAIDAKKEADKLGAQVAKPITRPVAVVTGATRTDGIGFQTCKQLAERGFCVVLTGRNSREGEQRASELRELGLQVEFQPLDVAQPGQAREVARHVAETYGRIDVLVNNAGVVTPTDRNSNSSSQLTKADFERAVRINTLGPLFVTRAFAPLLAHQHSGRIINITSLFGSLKDMEEGSLQELDTPFSAYRVAKAGANGLTRVLADEMADANVTVYAAHPGWVRTNTGGPDGLLSPEEGAQTTVSLATAEKPEYESGSFVGPDGPMDW